MIKSDDGKMILVELSVIGPEIQSRMKLLLKSCFGSVNLSPDYSYALNFADTKNESLQGLLAIDKEMTIWNVCASSFGKNYGAIKKLMEWVFSLDVSKDKTFSLYVDPYNSYWDRAIALYVKLGFEPKEFKNGKIFMLKSNGENLFPDLTINDANELRKNYFTSLGYDVVSIKYPAKELYKLLNQLVVDRHKEYSGFLKWKSNGQVYIVNLSSGNITETEVLEYPTNCVLMGEHSIVHFHTHPKITNTLIIQPPSDLDMKALFNTKFIRHYVFTIDGIFSIGFNLKTFMTFCENSMEIVRIQDDVIHRYKKIVNGLATLNIDPLRMTASLALSTISPKEQNNIIIDYYIEKVLGIIYPGRDHPVFDIKFWSNEYINKVDKITDFFVFKSSCLKPLTCDRSSSITKFPLTQEQMVYIDEMEKLEIRQNIEFAEQGIVIPYNERENNIDLWRLINPYSFVNIGLLFDKIKAIDQHDMAISLIQKGVMFDNIIAMLNNDLKYIKLAKNNPTYTELYKQSLQKEIISQSSKLISKQQSDILSKLSSISAFDVSKWSLHSQLGKGGYGSVVSLASIINPSMKIAFKTFGQKPGDHMLGADVVREIGSYAILQATGSRYTPMTFGVSTNGDVFGISIEKAEIPFSTFYQKHRELLVVMLPKIMDHTRAGLAEVHLCGLIHNDIKPDNILLIFNNIEFVKAVISDFGLSSSRTINGGTAGYRAPEVMAGKSNNSIKSDIWALGTSYIDSIMNTNNYRERNNGVVPIIMFDYLDQTRINRLENMIHINPNNRDRLHTTYRPRPKFTSSQNIDIPYPDPKTKKHAEILYERYKERKPFTQGDFKLAALNIARKWSNQKSVKETEDKESTLNQWEIITTLDGLIYL